MFWALGSGGAVGPSHVGHHYDEWRFRAEKQGLSTNVESGVAVNGNTCSWRSIGCLIAYPHRCYAEHEDSFKLTSCSMQLLSDDH